MDIGMLWFDDSTARTLREKIERAAAFYHERYGATPNVCFVHPSVLEGKKDEHMGNIAIRPSRLVLIDHFWLGVEVVTKPIKAPPTRRHKAKATIHRHSR